MPYSGKKRGNDFGQSGAAQRSAGRMGWHGDTKSYINHLEKLVQKLTKERNTFRDRVAALENKNRPDLPDMRPDAEERALARHYGRLDKARKQ